MFDNTFNVGDIPMETASGYGNTNLFAIGAMQGAEGMVSGLGRLAGFQTEDDLLKEIYDNADFSTPEGRQAAVDAVMRINPTAGKELQKQLSEAAVAEAQTQDIRIRSDQQKVDWTKKLHGSVYAKEFMRDATGDGLVASIHLYLERNGFVDYTKIKTVAQANTLMAKQRKKQKDYTTYKSGLEGYVSEQLDRYIDKRAIQDSGVQTITVDSFTAASTSMDLPDRTKETTEEKFITEGEGFDEEATDWDAYWSGIGRQNELSRQLDSVTAAMLGPLKFEMFMRQPEKDYENMEDAVSIWVGGGRTSAAFDWFLARSPEELVAFVNNPLAYYKKNIGKIEGTATYTGVDNTDLFANFDY